MKFNITNLLHKLNASFLEGSGLSLEITCCGWHTTSVCSPFRDFCIFKFLMVFQMSLQQSVKGAQVIKSVFNTSAMFQEAQVCTEGQLSTLHSSSGGPRRREPHFLQAPRHPQDTVLTKDQHVPCDRELGGPLPSFSLTQPRPRHCPGIRRAPGMSSFYSAWRCCSAPPQEAGTCRCIPLARTAMGRGLLPVSGRPCRQHG